MTWRPHWIRLGDPEWPSHNYTTLSYTHILHILDLRAPPATPPTSASHFPAIPFLSLIQHLVAFTCESFPHFCFTTRVVVVVGGLGEKPLAFTWLKPLPG